MKYKQVVKLIIDIAMYLIFVALIARLIQRSHTAMRKRSETLLTNAAFPVRSFLLQQRCGLQTAVMRKQRNHLRNL